MWTGKITNHIQNKSVQFRVSNFQDCLKLVDFFSTNFLLTKKFKDFKLWKLVIKRGRGSITFQTVKNWLNGGIQ